METIVSPWDQGLGVFDLSDLAWKDAFNASAAPYVTPQVVKSYYAHNPRYPASLLRDPILRAWFTGEASNSTSLNSTSNVPSNRHTANIGVIAGGTVVGVVVFVVLAVCVFVFLRQRQRKQRQRAHGRPPSGLSAFEKPELAGTRGLPGGSAAFPKPELSGTQSHPHEMPNRAPMHELDGQRNVSEMPDISRVEVPS